MRFVAFLKKSDAKNFLAKGIGWADGLLRKNPIVLQRTTNGRPYGDKGLIVSAVEISPFCAGDQRSPLPWQREF